MIMFQPLNEYNLFLPTYRAALNTVQQLKQILVSAPDEPSETLKEFFTVCLLHQYYH